jgi:hypothetical protein
MSKIDPTLTVQPSKRSKWKILISKSATCDGFPRYIRFDPVARWPHGCRRKYSEVAVPMLVSSNLTEGGGFFPRKKPPPGHGCVYAPSGLTVGWWKEESTLFRPPPRGQHGFESRREGRPWVYKCCVCL